MKYLKYIFIIFTIFCIVFIWYHSFQDGNESSLESQGVMNILKVIFSTFGLPDNISEYALRKMAHFLEFSGLGFLFTCDLYLWIKKPIKGMPLILFLGLLVGCIDETIQLFSVGRSSKVIDVWVDFSGICASVIVTVILIRLLFKINVLGESRA
ncbi:MAG: VanZ family protein [Lachnospirales bacterium]